MSDWDDDNTTPVYSSYNADSRHTSSSRWDNQERRDDGGSRNRDDRNGFSNSDGSQQTLTIEVAKNKVGMVIGRGGSTVREIQDRFNVNVNIGKRNF